MSEPAKSPAANLQEVARLLRATRHLEPDAQRALADLMDELAALVGPAAPPSPEAAHLAESTAQLAHALHQRHDTGLLAAAKKRLEESVIRAETEAPLASGIVRRLIETLANLGI